MSGSKTQKTRSYHTYLIESLQDPIEAAAYLEVALEEQDPALLLLVIQDIVEAQTSRSQPDRLQPLSLELPSQDEIAAVCQVFALLESLGFAIEVRPKQDQPDLQESA